MRCWYIIYSVPCIVYPTEELLYCTVRGVYVQYMYVEAKI
jgi:hypothetical protein